MSIAENLFLGNLGRFSAFGLVRRSAMTEAAADLIRRYDVRAPSASAPMANLSGGNQQKAVLARELSLDPLVFLLAAQPTRGLDIGAVGAVYDRIRQARDAGVGVLLISSELDELIAVADRILVIFRGRIIGDQPADPSAREAIGRLMAGETSREPQHERRPGE
jgi:general nucleoside transport system ATP-binding protein